MIGKLSVTLMFLNSAFFVLGQEFVLASSPEKEKQVYFQNASHVNCDNDRSNWQFKNVNLHISEELDENGNVKLGARRDLTEEEKFLFAGAGTFTQDLGNGKFKVFGSGSIIEPPIENSGNRDFDIIISSSHNFFDENCNLREGALQYWPQHDVNKAISINKNNIFREKECKTKEQLKKECAEKEKTYRECKRYADSGNRCDNERAEHRACDVNDVNNDKVAIIIPKFEDVNEHGQKVTIRTLGFASISINKALEFLDSGSASFKLICFNQDKNEMSISAGCQVFNRNSKDETLKRNVLPIKCNAISGCSGGGLVMNYNSKLYHIATYKGAFDLTIPKDESARAKHESKVHDFDIEKNYNWAVQNTESFINFVRDISYRQSSI